MQCPIVITPNGKITTKAVINLRALKREIDGWSLQPTRYFMPEQDFEDIIKGSGK